MNIALKNASGVPQTVKNHTRSMPLEASRHLCFPILPGAQSSPTGPVVRSVWECAGYSFFETFRARDLYLSCFENPIKRQFGGPRAQEPAGSTALITFVFERTELPHRQQRPARTSRPAGDYQDTTRPADHQETRRRPPGKHHETTGRGEPVSLHGLRNQCCLH